MCYERLNCLVLANDNNIVNKKLDVKLNYLLFYFLFFVNRKLSGNT